MGIRESGGVATGEFSRMIVDQGGDVIDIS